MSGEADDKLRVLDLFSAAAGGWSLGLHRAGFTTVAACESEEWRRILYAENNPGVQIYDDVRTLTGARLAGDLGTLPDIIVGSPPCQDISSANTKGKGVDGERSGLFFEAVRIVGEVRPRWVALENSANLRTKGADRVLAELEALGYACEPCVVGAGDGKRAAGVGANHERARSWILAFDPAQLANPDGFGRDARWSWRRGGFDIPVSNDPQHTPGVGHEGGWTRGCGADGDCPPSTGGSGAPPADAHQARQAHGCVESSLRQEEIARPRRGDERRDGSRADDQGQPDGAEHDEVGGGSSLSLDASGPWSEWNGGLAHHLRVDDGLSAWVAQSRVAVGGPRGTSAASLIVEAFGDAVIPQIPEAIGRAILRTEAALVAIYQRAA